MSNPSEASNPGTKPEQEIQLGGAEPVTLQPDNEPPAAPSSQQKGQGHGVDPLLESLLYIVKSHGRSLTAEAALAGLPLPGKVLTPSLFERAARRAQMSSRSAKVSLGGLNEHLFPAVLLLNKDDACVMLGWESNGYARIVFPNLPNTEIKLTREELESRYIQRVIYLRPEFRFDARAPEVGQISGRHWFWGTLAESAPLYRDVLLAAFLNSLFALALPIFTMNVYDRVVPNAATDTLWVLSSGLAIVLIFDMVMRLMRSHFIDLASARADVKLSAFIMERVLGMRMENKPLSVGSFASNLRSFETVRDFITSATVTTLIDVPFIFVYFIVIAWVALPMIVPALVAIVLIVIYALSVQSKMHELTETTYRAGALRNATLIESLVGLETLKALGAEGVMQRKWETTAAFLARVNSETRLLGSTTNYATAWLQQLTTVAVIIIGVYLITEKELTMGGLIACSMLTGRALGPLGGLTGMITQYHHAKTSLKSVDDIMAKEVERPINSKFVTRTGFSGDIEFKDVSFDYPSPTGQGTVSVLKNINLKIKAGERVAIIGKVGSGKSTLQKLILGLYRPSSGSILIDGIDIRQLDPAELRRGIGYVPQDANLFYGSLRENLTIAKPDAEDGDILRAATVGCIAEFVNRHPQGFDMVIGERGESLSGGQRQGIAIARSVINDPPILLLDEPTGAMDHSTETALKKQLGYYAVGKTMLVVTHRTSLLDIVDRIIVVDSGKVVADGPKAQVVEALRQGRIGRAE